MAVLKLNRLRIVSWEDKQKLARCSSFGVHCQLKNNDIDNLRFQWRIGCGILRSQHYINNIMFNNDLLLLCLRVQQGTHVTNAFKLMMNILVKVANFRFIYRLFHDTLQWRHNGCDGVSNHRRLGCLLNRLFRHRSKKTSKLRVTGGFPSEIASNAEMFPFDDVIMTLQLLP